MTKNIEVSYTGGGITLAEVRLDETSYAVVSTEAPEFFTIYCYDGDEKTYLPDDMVSSIQQDELSPEQKPLYQQMLYELNQG